MYLSQMGNIPLLSREREIFLAKQIELTRKLQLRGRMDVQMRGQADHSSRSILISGPLKSPLTQTANH